ncbi:MAG: hypothetical protein ABJC12_07110 [Saprospiraceae bacterium]
MPRKKKTPETPKAGRPSFHESLKGFDIKVNSFGEMESTFEIDKLNAFLNKEVPDKKMDPVPEAKPKRSSEKKASLKKKNEEEE